MPLIKVIFTVMALAHATSVISATFSYEASCNGGCFNGGGPLIFGVDPGLVGYIEVLDAHVAPGTGVSGALVEDFFFEAAGGGTYSPFDGYSIRFEDIGVSSDGFHLEYLDQGQAAGPFNIGFIYIEQGNLNTGLITLSFKHIASQPDTVEWDLTTANTSILLPLDSGAGDPFSAFPVPLPSPALLLVSALFVVFERKRLAAAA